MESATETAPPRQSAIKRPLFVNKPSSDSEMLTRFAIQQDFSHMEDLIVPETTSTHNEKLQTSVLSRVMG